MKLRAAIERVATDTKAFVLRFAFRSGSWWGGGGAVASRRERLGWSVGDGSGNSIVVAAVGWIGRNFPSAPPRVQEKDSDGELGNPTDVGAMRLEELLRAPNPVYGRRLMEMALIADYWITGKAARLKVRDETDGRVLSLWYAPSWSIKPKRREGSRNFVDFYEYKPTADTRYELRPEDVVYHRFGFDPDNPIDGISPLGSVLREIYTDDEAAIYVSTILRNLGVPGVIIVPDEEVDVEPEDADAIKAQFTNEFTREGRGRPMVLSAKSRIERVSFSPQELNLRDLRKIPEERVTAVLGLPAIVAGMGAGLDRSTFANFSEAREAAYEENIVPTHDLWDDDLRIQLLPDFVADPTEFVLNRDYSEVRVLQEDENKRWERFGAAFEKGAITLRAFNQGVGLPVDEKERDSYFVRPSIKVSLAEFDPETIGVAPAPEPPAADPNAGGSSAAVPAGTAPVEVPPVGATNGNGKAPAPAGAGR